MPTLFVVGMVLIAMALLGRYTAAWKDALSRRTVKCIGMAGIVVLGVWLWRESWASLVFVALFVALVLGGRYTGRQLQKRKKGNGETPNSPDA
jgi:hypothetical protein